MVEAVGFRVIENQLNIVFPEHGWLDNLAKVWDSDKARTLRMWNYWHRKYPDRWHEVYRLNDDGSFWGICQYKPGDPVNPEYDFHPSIKGTG